MPVGPRFHDLTVAQVRRETAGCVSVAFEVPDALADAYRFTQGQYLTLRREFDGEEVRRSYSICSGRDEGELRIAVKAVPGGRFSCWINTDLKPGDSLSVMKPNGRFHRPLRPGGSGRYALFAAGSGITPVISVARTVLASEPESEVMLFYGNRTAGDVIFREALDDLKSRHLSRFSVLHVLSGEGQEVPLCQGRIDAAKTEALMEAFGPAEAFDEALVCGPDDMADTVRNTLAAAGLAKTRIRTERFTGNPGQVAVPQAVAAGERAAGAAEITAVLDGARQTFAMSFDGERIIDAGRRQGLDLPFSCKGGMCCACRARVVSGRVEMLLNFSLEPWELEAGFVLTCQSRPLSREVVVDYDAL